MMSKKKVLSIAVAAGFAFQMGAMAMPAQASAAEADTAALQSEIKDLSERLAKLEGQLKAVKSNQSATKAQIKKLSKNKNGLVKWSGSTKAGYWTNSSNKTKMKSEFKLTGDAKLGDGWSVKLGLKFKNTNEEYGRTEKNKIKLTYASTSKTWKLGDKRKIVATVGTDKYKVGEGLWLSKSSVYGQNLKWDVTKNDRIQIHYGRDTTDYLADEGDISSTTKVEQVFNEDGTPKTDEKGHPVFKATTKSEAQTGRARMLKFIEWKHSFADKDSYIGVYAGSHQPDTYLGIFGNYEIPNTKFWVNAEFIKGTNTNKLVADAPKKVNPESYAYEFYNGDQKQNAYVFTLGYGHAKKKGEWEVTLEKLYVAQSMFMDDNYTDWDDYTNGAQGMNSFSAAIRYCFSDRTKLQLIRYWGHTVDNGWTNADGETSGTATANSTYLKFTTKF